MNKNTNTKVRLDGKQKEKAVEGTKPRRSYTEEEDELILAHTISDSELSAKIGRSVGAIRKRRYRLISKLDQHTDKPADKHSDKPADKHTDKPTDQHVDKLTDQDAGTFVEIKQSKPEPKEKSLEELIAEDPKKARAKLIQELIELEDSYY